MNVSASSNRNYADLHDHLDRLDRAGLLYRIDAPINKDTEMHPLVRWQFRGGIAEKDRKAFLFSNIVDSKGRRYDIPVAIGVFAANAEIYRIGMNVDRFEDIGPLWERAISNPVAPQIVDDAPCQEIVVIGARARRCRPRPGIAAGPNLHARLRCRSLSYGDLRHHPRSRYRRPKRRHISRSTQVADANRHDDVRRVARRRL